MKKIVYFISVLTTCLCLNRNVQAFVWPDFTPLIPFSPQFCVMCIPPAIDWAYNTVDQVKDAKNRLKEMTDVTKIKQALSAYAANLGNMALNWTSQRLSARKKVISYSRTIMDSQREGVDVKKEDSVKVDFVNLFLQYPSTKSKIKSAYQKKGNAIKMDTALEMYITASEMTKELCGAKGKGCDLATTLSDYEGDVSTEFKDTKDMGMMLQISLVEQCFMQGQYCDLIGMIGCEPSKDSGSSDDYGEQPTEGESTDEDKVCHWKTSLQIARMYDKIMRYNEMLVYMQSQYEAIKGIDTLAKIRAAKENENTEGDKGAFLMDKYLPQKNNIAYSTLSDTFAFADEELTDEDLEEFSKYEKSMSNRENVLSGNFETLKEAKGFESVLDDKHDDLASMQVLEDVKKALNDALVYHNMKQMLPDYRGTFKTLKQSEEYHDKTVEYLQDSGECIKGYLEPHYNDPAKVWFGEGCDYFDKGTIYCHYSPEKEISNEEESKGIYDDLCPDNPQYKCFIQKLEESDFNKGVAGALLAFYNEGKTADALQETQTYLKEGDEQSPEVKTENSKENSYTAQVTIEGGDEVSGDKDTYVTGRDDSVMMSRDNANASDVLPRVSSVQTKSNTPRDDQEADENVKDPKAAESLSDETRKGHLMNWIWGATMANIISNDLDSVSPKFGSRKNKFPLWNDQKEFYDQYIDGKYDNIAQYMERAPMPDGIMSAAKAINDVFEYEPIIETVKDAMGKVKLEVKIEKEQQQEVIADAIESVKDRFADVKDKTKEAMDALIAQETIQLEALKTKHNAKMKKLLEEKELLQSRLGQNNKDLDSANLAFNNAGGKIASSVNTERATEENDKLNTELQSKYRTSIDLSASPANKQFSGMKSESVSNKKIAETELKTKEKEAQNLEKNSEMLAKLLKAKKEEIEKERRQFVKEYSEAEEKAKNEFTDKVAAYEDEGVVLKDEDVTAVITTAIEEASEKLSKELSETYGAEIAVALPTVAASGAGQMIACLREKASQIAKNTKENKFNQMKSSGEIYYNEFASKVAGVHSTMIQNMKSISDCMVDGIPSQPIAEKVFGDMCDSISCTTPEVSKDEDTGLINYFVGALGVKDDLKAPTPPVAFSSAPMREIFHFDISDYESIEKYYKDDNLENPSSSDITITAEGFLKLGEDMQSTQKDAQQNLESQDNVAGTFPEIWKYVLKRHAYGQKQFDLKRLLGSKELGDDVRGDPDKSYLRSGSFPCYIDNNVIDASAVVKLSGFRLVLNNFSYTINNTPDKNLYTQVPCKGLLIKNGRVFDFAADGSPPNGIAVSSKENISESSELGTILGYVPDANSNIVKALFSHGIPTDMSKVTRKLTFNPTLQRSVNIISETEELGEDKSKDAVFYMANRTLLDRNQFGDYLNQLEQESIARESLMKVRNQIDEILENLRDVFYGTSIIISDEFNLLNDSDYKEAADALDEQKQIYLNRAETEIQKVKGISETVRNKTEMLLKTIAVLHADSNELIHLNGTEDINQVKSKIANQSADNSVVNEYDKMGDEAHERRIRDLQPPFCEVHPYK